jgi:predicted amidophosphoribosyltransferase
MPWCPQCGAEFVPGIKLCSDCQVPLQEEPPSKSVEQPEADMIPVFKLEDYIQATILQSILKESEIPSMVADGYLLVPKNEAESADFIITEYLNALDMGEMPENYEEGDSEEEPNG